MANGLEVRPPLLDHELLELAARIPSHWKVRGGETKWLFKRAYEADLPTDVIRGPKRGFEMPVDAWLRGPLREVFEAAVLAPGHPVGGLIATDVVRPLYRTHRAGTGRHGALLWNLLVLARWAEHYLTAAPAARPPECVAS
jgi:asparagine synthase (glutamine-hydrolysing)